MFINSSMRCVYTIALSALSLLYNLFSSNVCSCFVIFEHVLYILFPWFCDLFCSLGILVDSKASLRTKEAKMPVQEKVKSL